MGVVRGLLRVSLLVLLLYGGLLFLTYREFTTAPSGFIPEQDKGYLLLSVQLPDSASVQRTDRVMAQIEKIAHDTHGVAPHGGHLRPIVDLRRQRPNLGSMYVVLKDFAERRGPELTADAIATALRASCEREVRGAVVAAYGAPPIEGFGTTAGFKLIIEQRGTPNLAELQRSRAMPSSSAAIELPACTACPTAPAPTPPGFGWTSIAPSAWPWVCRSATFSTRCRAISAPTT